MIIDEDDYIALHEQQEEWMIDEDEKDLSRANGSNPEEQAFDLDEID